MLFIHFLLREVQILKSFSMINDFKIEDLLGRKPITIENNILNDKYNNTTILVTGAAGSIGSEIVRRLTHFNYKKLILLDNAESPLYDLQQELKREDIKKIIYVIADIRNVTRLNSIFNLHKPQIVFHAAAYKHVPLMEDHPFEAVNVNILGTKNVADIALKYGIHKFVLISTDKAVNPTNVMGASKRIAELYTKCLKDVGKTKFIIIRLGNVLGSNGSVIPLFKKQIASGGPITVTHREIIRYFMAIPEACRLILEAATMGVGGEIFVFDMGKPIKIFELAKNMIFLSGLRFPEDIDIKITGLRPGEKIYEELLADDENANPTYHKKIMVVMTTEINTTEIKLKINTLCKKSSNVDSFNIVSLIKDLVPEYISNNSKYEILDKKTKQT